MRLVLTCVQDPAPDVRQSALALVGDLSKNSIAHLGPWLPQFLPAMCQHLTLDAESYSGLPKQGGRRQNPLVSVANNAVWAMGELTTKIGPQIEPYAGVLLPALIKNLNCETLNPSLLQNSAITIGRLALVCPQVVAPQLETFAVRWCYRMARMRDDLEKDHACRGLCNMIRLNAQGIIKAFLPFLLVVASWANPPADLQTMFAQIIDAFVANLGTTLQAYVQNPAVLEGVGGAEAVQRGIGWDPEWQKQQWDVNHLLMELQKRGYKLG